MSGLFAAPSENLVLDPWSCWYLSQRPSFYCLHFLYLDGTAWPWVYHRKEMWALFRDYAWNLFCHGFLQYYVYNLPSAVLDFDLYGLKLRLILFHCIFHVLLFHVLNFLEKGIAFSGPFVLIVLFIFYTKALIKKHFSFLEEQIFSLLFPFTYAKSA